MFSYTFKNINIYKTFSEFTCCFRSAQIGDTIKHLTNQLLETNATSENIFTLDTRTPPKIKQHVRKKTKNPMTTTEHSHAGVAIPVDEDHVLLQETTKKLHFYKVDKPTTNSGISTWVLLSEQTTMKPSRKPIAKQNTTVMVDQQKIIKPIFKKRGTTTTTIKSSSIDTATSTPLLSTTKLTKVKASILNNAKKVFTTTTSSTTPLTTTIIPESIATTIPEIVTLPAEAKEGETDLSTETTTKKTRRTSTNKRKKNKNKRRRPTEKTNDITNKIDKPINTKGKPIGTQLYNYLSREIMPTVGVGLVGLMVTAGLASYFLYPFGVARRSYEVDRKDKDYYYMDEYSGGIAEEEAIGKVIAGMPTNALYGNLYKTPTSRHGFNNRRIVEQEEITPAAVPEHGPRKLRKRRQLQNAIDEENEIDSNLNIISTTSEETTSQENITSVPDRKASILEFMKEIFHLKLDLGLQFLQRASEAVNTYVTKMQKSLKKSNTKFNLN